MSRPVKLYTPELLGCAVRLSEYPLAGDFTLEADARSATCGSTLRIGLECDDRGRVNRVGIRAQACAVGQAAAAILAEGVAGMSDTEILSAANQIRDWLTSPTAPEPDWPGIDMLAAARAHPARHGAVMLAWDAALRALSNADNGR